MKKASTGEKKLVFIDDNFSGHFWENGTYHNPDSCYVCIAKNMKEITHIVGEVMTKPPTPQSETPHKEHGEWESIFYRTLAFNDLNWNYKNNVETTPKEVVNFIRQLLLSTQQEAVEKERERVKEIVTNPPKDLVVKYGHYDDLDVWSVDWQKYILDSLTPKETV